MSIQSQSQSVAEIAKERHSLKFQSPGTPAINDPNEADAFSEASGDLALNKGAARYARREGEASTNGGGEGALQEPEPNMPIDAGGPQGLAGEGERASQHAGLGPANASAREVERLLAERPERRSEDEDSRAGGWLNLTGASTPAWLAAMGGVAAVGAVAAGGGSGGSGMGAGSGVGGGVGVTPPTDGAVILPPVQPPSDPASLGTPSLRLQVVAPAPVNGLPSTKEPTVNVGNLEPDGAWFYRVDGQDWVRGQASQIPSSVFVDQGQHTVEVYQMDLAGNEGPVATLEFWYDSIPPLPADVSLKHDSGDATDLVSSDATLVVAGVAAGDDWYFSVDGGDWQQGHGNELPDVALGGDGAHTVSVVVRDPSGNESAPTTISVVRDTIGPTTGPTISLLFDSGDDDTDRLTNDPTLIFSGLEAGARWSLSLDGGQSWIDAAGTSAVDMEFHDKNNQFNRDGAWTVLARQIDAAGNVGTATSSFTFELDRTRPDAPTVRLKEDTGLFDDDRVTSKAAVVIGGVQPGDSWQYRLDGEVTWTMIVGNEILNLGLANGHHVLEVATWDTAGNRSAIQSLEFWLDTVPPGLPDLGLVPYTSPVVI